MAKAKRVVARVEQDPEVKSADTASESSQVTETTAAEGGKQAPAQAEPKKDKAASAAAAPAKKRAPKARVAVDSEPASGAEAARPKASKAQASSGASQQSAAGREARTSSKSGLMGRVSALAPGHEGAFLGGILGLLVALLAFAIGPGRTLVVLLFVIVGVTVGQILDGDTRLVSLVQRLLRGGDED